MSQTTVIACRTVEAAKRLLAAVGKLDGGFVDDNGTEARLRDGDCYLILSIMAGSLDEYREWGEDGTISIDVAERMSRCTGVYCQFNHPELMRDVLRIGRDCFDFFDTGYAEVIEHDDVMAHLKSPSWTWV